MTDRAALIEALRTIVARVVGASRAPADMSPDTPLGEGGLWLDSLELLQVVIASEAQFEITFAPGQDLVDARLKTLGTLAEMIDGRRALLARTHRPTRQE